MRRGWPRARHSRRPDAGCRRGRASSGGSRRRSGGSRRASGSTRGRGSAKRPRATRRRRRDWGSIPAAWRGRRGWSSRRRRWGATSCPKPSAGRWRRGPRNPIRLPRTRCIGCTRITRRPAAGSRRSCGTAGIAWMRPRLGRKRLTSGSTRQRRFAARGCGCSARARERSSTIRHGSGCPAPPTNANGCMRPWTHLGRRCRGSARRRSWNSAGASPRMASRRTPIRSTCRHGGLCGIAPRHFGARRGSHRTRARRSMRCSPAMPAWRPRSLPSEPSSKRAPCTCIGARRWMKGFAASTPRPRMRSRTGGNARRAFARPPRTFWEGRRPTPGKRRPLPYWLTCRGFRAVSGRCWTGWRPWNCETRSRTSENLRPRWRGEPGGRRRCRCSPRDTARQPRWRKPSRAARPCRKRHAMRRPRGSTATGAGRRNSPRPRNSPKRRNGMSTGPVSARPSPRPFARPRACPP